MHFSGASIGSSLQCSAHVDVQKRQNTFGRLIAMLWRSDNLPCIQYFISRLDLMIRSVLSLAFDWKLLVDPDECLGYGTRVERCQVHAISNKDGVSVGDRKR